MTLPLESIRAFIAEKCVNDAKPLSARDAESVYGVKEMRRPLPTTPPAFPMMPSDEPEKPVSAERTHAIDGHSWWQNIGNASTMAEISLC